ncbi:hypothetical protein ES708_05432 [subsurface metagenome]
MKFGELKRQVKRKEAFAALICLLPAGIFAAIFVFIPIISVFYISLTNMDIARNTSNFIGIGNFIFLFKNEKFIKSIINTLYFAAVKIPLDLVLALFLAVLLDKGLKGERDFSGRPISRR